jgi:group II intron reverse transcriptase/maturase
MLLPAMTIEEVASERNLAKAFQRVASNKGAPGPDRRTIAEVQEHLHEVLPSLRRKLLDGTYRPGRIRRVWIPKSGGQRGLGIPNVIDRLVGQAVYQVLCPHYEPTFHGSSHGFRPDRSCHTAIAEAKQHVENGNEWLIDLDLEKFFDRIHHDRLLARLERRIEDRRLIQLIRHMLKAKVVLPNGVVVSTEEGSPQGAPLSPLLSNVVLDELDWELERRGHRFVRYADDANIYVRSERAGRRVMASIVKFIEGRLRLKVNQSKSAVDQPHNRHFVGFRLKKGRRGRVEVRLSHRSKARMAEKIRELTPRKWGRSFDDCIAQINGYLLGWIGFFQVCGRSERETLKRMDAHIRRRLRAIQLKQWKRRRTIARRLIKKGVSPGLAWCNVYKGHRSWWALTRCAAVERGLNNGYFARRGLISLVNEYERLNPKKIIAPPQLRLRWNS